MSQTNTTQIKVMNKEEFWKAVETLAVECAREDSIQACDELIFEVIEELGSSISKQNVWERIKELAEEVLENASLD